MLEFHVHTDMGLKAAAELAVKLLCEILIVLNRTQMGIQKISTNLYDIAAMLAGKSGMTTSSFSPTQCFYKNMLP